MTEYLIIFQDYSVVFYRNDGLAVVKGLSGPENGRMKKTVQLKPLKIVDSKSPLKEICK